MKEVVHSETEQAKTQEGCQTEGKQAATAAAELTQQQQQHKQQSKKKKKNSTKIMLLGEREWKDERESKKLSVGLDENKREKNIREKAVSGGGSF